MSIEPEKDHSIADHRRASWLEEKRCARGKKDDKEIKVGHTGVSSDLI